MVRMKIYKSPVIAIAASRCHLNPNPSNLSHEPGLQVFLAGERAKRLKHDLLNRIVNGTGMYLVRKSYIQKSEKATGPKPF